MRLIDADILESWIDGGIQGAEEVNGNAPIVSLYDVLSELDDIPTVDAVVLPCMLGDKIYQTDGIRIYESTINEITLTTKRSIFVTENIAFDERAIRKSIFLTREEAEAALAAMAGERRTENESC